MAVPLRPLALVALAAPLVAFPALGEPAAGTRARALDAEATRPPARVEVRGWDPLQKKAIVGKTDTPHGTAPGGLAPSVPKPATKKRPGRVKYGDITLKKGYVDSSPPSQGSPIQHNQTDLEFQRERAAGHEATHSVQQKQSPGPKR